MEASGEADMAGGCGGSDRRRCFSVVSEDWGSADFGSL